jgi:hypothetical protein
MQNSAATFSYTPRPTIRVESKDALRRARTTQEPTLAPVSPAIRSARVVFRLTIGDQAQKGKYSGEAWIPGGRQLH